MRPELPGALADRDPAAAPPWAADPDTDPADDEDDAVGDAEGADTGAAAALADARGYGPEARGSTLPE